MKFHAFTNALAVSHTRQVCATNPAFLANFISDNFNREGSTIAIFSKQNVEHYYLSVKRL